ncbi:hypothetical protein INT44_001513, partial [Umbelopsis vinacea]
GIQHVEEPYYQKVIDYKMLASEVPPVEKLANDAKAKTEIWQITRGDLDKWSLAWIMGKITCDLERQKEAADKGLLKARGMEAEAKAKVDAIKDKLSDIERDNEKNAIDHRTLLRYREEVDSLFEPVSIYAERRMIKNIPILTPASFKIFVGQKYPTDEDFQIRLTELKEEKEACEKDVEVTARVLELLQEVDTALMEGIIDLTSSKKETGSGRIFFPDAAFNALKEARALLPSLPSIAPPDTFTETADNTGAYYSPMQRYLWEVKDKVADLIPWCQTRTLDNARKIIQLELQIGQKTDERNLERRRLVKDVVLSA